jgi:hypothetical protein
MAHASSWQGAQVGGAGYESAMPTPVDGRANLHTATCYGQPLGVRCRSCERRALVPLDGIGAHTGNMRPLDDLPLKCSGCGRRDVELWLFIRKDEAEAWADDVPNYRHGHTVRIASIARYKKYSW